MNKQWWLKVVVISLHVTSITGAVCSKDKVIGTEKFKSEPNKVDPGSKTSFMVRDPAYIVPCCGVISKWTVFIKKSGAIHFQVWRDRSTGSYMFVGENLATYYPGEEEKFYTVVIDNEHKIPVKEGDYIGWYSPKKSMPGYITEKKGFGALSASIKNKFEVGEIVDWSDGQVSSPRTYALAASVTKGTPPKLENLDASIELNDDMPPGTSIYTLTFVGFESGIRPHNYRVSMDTVTDYFHYNSTTNMIYLTKHPPVNKFTIDIVAKDHCETSSKGKLKITFNSRTPRIRNLPSSAFVREDTHRMEILLKELNVTYRENVICTLQKVNPPKTESYFTLKAIPDKEFVYGLYLKSTADLDYDNHDLYILSVKCAEGKASDVQDLYVYVEANKAPVFVNVPGSFHVDARKARVADALYQVNATDDESDVIRHKLICDNVQPCPFNITKDGTVYLQESLNRTIAKIVYLNITLQDNFNEVGPKILIANITNFNRPPYIEDMTSLTVTINENTPEGYSIFEVNAHDPDNDDVITFSLDVRPSQMRQYFAINETNGLITSVSPMDFEGVKFKVTKLIVSVSDGKDESSSFLKVALIDENEPPEFTFGSFSMHILEGDPSSKNDLRIKAKDFDKTGSISFGIECVNETNSFQINENTGVVSQVLNIDVDKLNVSEEIVECNITATDTGGLSSYAPLTIFIMDINDNSPTFIKTSFMFVVSDKVPVYGEIGNALAIDKDVSPENNQIFYQIDDEKDDFIIDENGTIHMMKDVTKVPFGSVFKYNVTAEDKDELSDTVPITIVIIANFDPALLTAGSRFLSFPENVIWVTSAAYILCIALGLGVFLITYYLRCFIRRQGRRVSDSSSCQSRGMSVNSVLSAKMYNNVFDVTSNRDGIVLSPVSNLRYAGFTKSAMSIRRTESISSQQKSGDRMPRETTDITIDSKRNRITNPSFISRQTPSKDTSFNTKQIDNTDKAVINENNVSINTKLTNRSTPNVTRQATLNKTSTPYPMAMSVGQHSTTSELPLSSPLSSPLSKPNTWSKCSLSDINPSGSGSWKPWSVNDFQTK